MKAGLAKVLLCFALFALARPARADAPFSDVEILGAKTNDVRIVSVDARLTGFDQFGYGYQSQLGPPHGPGTERTTVFEPQLEVVATQGDRITHRVWIPVDVVTAASPDGLGKHDTPPDVTSGASRHVGSGTFEWMTTYKADAATLLSMRNGFHLEEPFRSYNSGLSFVRSFADDNTTFSANANEVFDWFDRFDINGKRHGRAVRNTINGNVGLTQLLSPTTIVHADYGLTLQEGDLGNTWNAVPLETGAYGPGILPRERVRHALFAKIAQHLPWNGALKASYRFYADDWGIAAHTTEVQLFQRFSPWLFLRATYRYHTQTGAYFFTTSAPDDGSLRTADSDSQGLDAQTIGIMANISFRDRQLRDLHMELGYERYFRTNDLTVDIATWAVGFRF